MEELPSVTPQAHHPISSRCRTSTPRRRHNLKLVAPYRPHLLQLLGLIMLSATLQQYLPAQSQHHSHHNYAAHLHYHFFASHNNHFDDGI